jgi:hypothetical protein
MNNSRMPKIVLNYRSNGLRQLGRPLKRLLKDQAQLVTDDDGDVKG